MDFPFIFFFFCGSIIIPYIFHSKVAYLVRLCTINADHIAHSTSSFFIPRIIQALGQRHSICINLHFNICSCTLFTACQFNLEMGEKGRDVRNACVTSPINMDPNSYLICRIRFIGRPVSACTLHA